MAMHHRVVQDLPLMLYKVLILLNKFFLVHVLSFFQSMMLVMELVQLELELEQGYNLLMLKVVG